MTHREQAEELRLALVMGLIEKSDVIKWADALIMQEATPPKWLLDVSLAANESKDTVGSRLQDAVDRLDVTVPRQKALGRFARVFRSGELAPLNAAEMLVLWAYECGDGWDRGEAAEAKFLAEDVAEGRCGSWEDVRRAIDRFLARHEATRDAG